MKKLMIIAAVAFAAVASQAAQVSWGMTNVQNSPDKNVAAGWLVQLISQDVAFDLAKAQEGTLSVTATSSTAYNSTTGFYNVDGAKFGSFAAGDKFGYYAVIWDAATVADAKNYFVTGVKTGSIAGTGADKSLSFGSMASSSTTSAFYNKSWQSVPEPTSGLLLLIGMAGLALRRRRA